MTWRKVVGVAKKKKSATTSGAPLAEKFKRAKQWSDVYKYAFIAFTCAQFLAGATFFCFSAWFVVPGINNLFRLSSTETTMDTLELVVIILWFSAFAFMSLSVLAFVSVKALNKYLMGVQFFCAISMSVVMLLLLGFCFVLHSKLQSELNYNIARNFIENYRGDGAHNWQSVLWKHIQKDLRCCGVRKNSTDDYSSLDVGITGISGFPLKGAAFWRDKTTDKQLWPESCCKRSRKKEVLKREQLLKCTSLTNATEYRYTQGCQPQVESLLDESCVQLMAFVIFATGLQLGFSVVIVKSETHSALSKKLEEAIQLDSVSKKRKIVKTPDVRRSNTTSRTEQSSRTEQCCSSRSSFEQSVELIDLEGGSNNGG